MNTPISWLGQQAPENLTHFYEALSDRLNPEDSAKLGTLFKQNHNLLQEFHCTLSASLFVQQTLLGRPNILLELLHNDLVHKSVSLKFFQQVFNTSAIEDEQSLDARLRQWRTQAMVRIVWRDFNRLADFDETTDDLSNLARASIQASLRFHYRQMAKKFGTPRCQSGEAQPLLILAMGKLGANELNLSSDIDLIFTYPQKGNTDHPDKPLANQEFFAKLGKKIIYSLDNKTADGFVFRVDMRLRPYGQSGALVYSFDALEEYYQNQGREWERYAMVKASVVANNGSNTDSETLMRMLRSFTYRKYIDFSVIDALRNLKKMITQEVKRRRLEEDIKLGAGGIREIEFIAQVFQLIRGGRDVALRDNRILKTLPLLAELRCLPQQTVCELIDAYLFLRNTEHAIQGYKDEQTQCLPADLEARKALCRVMGFSDWDTFYQHLHQHRAHVKRVFASVIASPEESEDDQGEANSWIPVWQERLEKSVAIEQFKEARHENPQLAVELIRDLNTWASMSAMHTTSRERLDLFMPSLLARLTERTTPTETLSRLIKLLKAIARRSAYLLLLMENPHALQLLLELTGASPWIADRLAEHPALLDELLDSKALYRPPQKDELQAELRRTTLRIPEDDLEAQMEALRYFRSAHALRVAASEITGALPLMKVSDYLTWIAEVILDYVLEVSWGQMVKKYGYPDGEQRQHPNFIIVGYGKLGGIELSHGSDLDLVFIHDTNLNGSTGGPRCIDNQTFFMRLGQKIIHFLTTTMSSGALYDVDMRLRPSGNSGMLVASLGSFTKYQAESAWTWEHQALVRARVIAGDAHLKVQFERVRADILGRPRDTRKLREEVVEMRDKMRNYLGMGKSDTNAHQFHLKHDSGGIVDIEFMVQYGVLAWAHAHPELANYTDNIRILESFEHSNLLDTQEVHQLTEAYKAFRAAGHRLTLQQQPSQVDADQFVGERKKVSKIWQRLMV